LPGAAKKNLVAFRFDFDMPFSISTASFLTTFMNDNEKALIEAADTLESFRRAVNEAFTKAPENIDFNFSTTLDELADHQYKLSQVWKTVIENNDSAAARTAAKTIIEEAQRATLSAWRAVAEARQAEATDFRQQIADLQVDVTELISLKKKCDTIFDNAIQLHEKNDIAALIELQKSDAEYLNFTSKAIEKIAGARAITKRETRRQRMVYTSTICSIVAIIISTIMFMVLIVGRDKFLNFFSELFGHPK
jgi:glycerol-3-phosphate cytidylyltransferase-like family protein